MKIKHLFLIALVALIGGLWASAEEEPRRSMADGIDKLIRQSRANERDRWWPAVEQLAEIARNDITLRDEIWARAKVNTLGMKFVPVLPGTFIMGPDLHRLITFMQVRHRVRLSCGYLISVTEVTNAQFQKLFPEYEADSVYSPDPDSPAVGISWDEAKRFCESLSKNEGVVYRLPTEAEWEYACRAGTRTRFCFGDDPSRLGEFACSRDSAKGRACRVACFEPNDWGIYDMHSNVAEWVSDWFSLNYYMDCIAKGAVEDPEGPAEGWSHVLRSGGWDATNLWANTCTARFPLPVFDRFPLARDDVPFRRVVGFRIVRELGH